MNTRNALNDAVGARSLSVNFNADSTYFAVGLENGFRIYDAENCEISSSRELAGGIGAAEMRERSDCIALVGGGKQPLYSQNKVILWNDTRKAALLNLEFRTPVQRVRLSRMHIIVALLNSVHMYSFASPPVKLSEFETVNNPFGLCCLGPKISVFPGRTHGQVRIVELGSRNVSIIPAHSSPLRALALSLDGEVLATASENGTLVRVWSTTNCSKVAELRRGIDQATVFGLAISPTNTLIAVTSDKSTLHIFDLPRYGSTPSNRPNTPSRSSTSHLSIDSSAEPDTSRRHKWGLLGRLPFMPRLFSDEYSSASTHFEIGDEPAMWQAGKSLTWNAPIPGVPGGRPPKGVVGWLNSDQLIVIGSGQDARWERFRISFAENGRRICYREGWKRYLE